MDCEVISLARCPQNAPGPHWTDDRPPVCLVGLELLRRFEAARPNDSAFLELQDLTNLGTSAFGGIPEWDAVAEHCGTCRGCKAQHAASTER